MSQKSSLSLKSLSLKSLSLKNYKSNEIVCAVIIIALAVIIPRYIRLPKNVELLFNDRIGQILLLLLAVMVGSYNFVCGVLLVVLFLSIMINVSSVEGFENPADSEDEDVVMESENFEEDVAAEEESSPTPSTSDEKIKELEEKISKLEQEKSEESSPTPKSTKRPTAKPTMAMEDEEQASDEMESETQRKKKVAMSVKESSKKETEDTIEGFNCGCDTNDRRSKLINYARADQVDPSLSGLFETFENPPQSKDIKTPNPFDVAGCRYDLKESNQLHETIYGAPLDSCMAYQSANVAGTGTVFYPLNAF
jgi:hypothetical protein